MTKWVWIFNKTLKNVCVCTVYEHTGWGCSLGFYNIIQIWCHQLRTVIPPAQALTSPVVCCQKDRCIQNIPNVLKTNKQTNNIWLLVIRQKSSFFTKAFLNQMKIKWPSFWIFFFPMYSKLIILKTILLGFFFLSSKIFVWIVVFPCHI